MSRASRIEATLKAVLKPTLLEVRDDSALHHGHAGSRPGGETHYHITVVSAQFSGKSKIQCHRMVMEALREEFASGLHALSMDLKESEYP